LAQSMEKGAAGYHVLSAAAVAAGAPSQKSRKSGVVPGSVEMG